MSSRALLEVENVVKVYGSAGSVVRAVDGVSVELKAGEVLAIFGPSGSGKTTFLMIAGLIDIPDSGRVLFRGEVIATHATELDDLRTFRRRHIGFVFQRANLIPFLTAVENVQVAMHLNAIARKEAAARAWFLLRQLHVDHRGHAMPHQLSGGEQQRVAIARALARSPRVVLADEPTGNLDTRNGEMVMELLARLHGEVQVTLVLVTHDEWIAERADRVLRLADGRLVGDSDGQAAEEAAR